MPFQSIPLHRAGLNGYMLTADVIPARYMMHEVRPRKSAHVITLSVALHHRAPPVLRLILHSFDVISLMLLRPTIGYTNLIRPE